MLSLKEINKASDVAWGEMKKLCEQAQRANVLSADLTRAREALRRAEEDLDEMRRAALEEEEVVLRARLDAAEKSERALHEMDHYRILQEIQKRREVELDEEDAARTRKWRRSHALACRALWERDAARAREAGAQKAYEKMKAERDTALVDLRSANAYPMVYMKTTLEACVARNAALEKSNRDLSAKLHDACVRAAVAERELADLRAGSTSACAAGGGAAAGAKRARYGSLDEDSLLAIVAANEA